MLTTAEKVELIQNLFVHGSNSFGIQTWDDKNNRWKYVPQRENTCPNDPPCENLRACSHRVDHDLTGKDIVEHLKGSYTVGVYSTMRDTVKWVCLDVDIQDEGTVEDAQAITLDIVKRVYTLFKQKCYVVEYSGSKGYHVWVFFDEPIDANLAFTFGYWIKSKISTPVGIGIEAFPKQGATSRYGNLVKLPLGIHRGSSNRSVFIRKNFTPITDPWTAMQAVTPISKEVVEAVMSDHNIQIVEPTPASGGGLPCISRMLEEGFTNGQRDEGNFTLACHLKNAGLPQDYTELILSASNEKSIPPMDTYELRVKIDSAYSRDYSGYPCSKASLDSYCSSSCKLWPNKLSRRWTSFGNSAASAIGQISRD